MLLRRAEFRLPLAPSPANSSTSSAPAASFGVENGGKVHPAADDSRIVPDGRGSKNHDWWNNMSCSIYPSSYPVVKKLTLPVLVPLRAKP